MSYRFMRAFIFFDLPTLTPEDRKSYRHFHKFLIRNGFIMLQESVYCKLITTPTVESSIKNLINKHKPPKGLVQYLSITEKQFSRMEYVVGEYSSDIISSNEHVVIL